MPGQPVRAYARFRNVPGDSPSGIASCRWLCRNHSTDSGTPTFSLQTLSASLSGAARQKTRPLVQKLWTLRLPCGRTWKIEANCTLVWGVHSCPPTFAVTTESQTHTSQKESGSATDLPRNQQLIGVLPNPGGLPKPKPALSEVEGRFSNQQLIGVIPSTAAVLVDLRLQPEASASEAERAISRGPASCSVQVGILILYRPKKFLATDPPG